MHPSAFGAGYTHIKVRKRQKQRQVRESKCSHAIQVERLHGTSACRVPEVLAGFVGK